MIKYLGSKRKLLPALMERIRELPDVRHVTDFFSGTARVGHALKSAAYHVTSNDHNSYAYTIALCYVQSDANRLQARAERLIAELQALPPQPGYFTQTYCERARFFQPQNGARIDAIRERIEELELEPELKAIALVSLMEAADRVDSTTGVQMAYLKQWAPRAHNDLQLRLPNILPGLGRATCADALELAASIDCDLAYLDPPYNSHSYLGNYHIWESLVRWDKPEVYGIACKRIDCRDRKSEFNFKRRIAPALQKLVTQIRARHILVSFNNEGYIDRAEMESLLASRGEVQVYTIPHDRYVGARIGIYNPQGDRVGNISHTRNLEYLYYVRVEQPPTTVTIP